jgi:hypothetical protein
MPAQHLKDLEKCGKPKPRALVFTLPTATWTGVAAVCAHGGRIGRLDRFHLFLVARPRQHRVEKC